ncbi:PASTA domain-containing protein [Rhodococcus sp. T2V]|nr:PASTA domain-containing protein [Rhodococcus sp. T2V]
MRERDRTSPGLTVNLEAYNRVMRKGGPVREVREVPDVVGFGADDACAIVRGAGLIPVGPKGAGAPTVGVIVAQRPIGAAGIEKGGEVILWNQDSGGAHGAPVPRGHESAALDPV